MTADDVMQMINLIKPKSREAEALIGIPVRDRDSTRRAARYLLEQGVRTVAFKPGNEGSLIVTPDNEYWFRKLPIESINATGDGDAFAAPLTVALLEKRSWEAMGAWGSAAVVEDN